MNSHKNLSDVVTLQEDIYLESPVFFQSLNSSQVIAKDLVTGLDLDKWFEKAITNHSPQPIYIQGNWTAKNLKVLNTSTDFQYTINGYEPWQYYNYMRSAFSHTNDTEEMKEICQLIKQICHELENKSQRLKYIEEVSNMDLKLNAKMAIRRVFFLKGIHESILLINFPCESLTYKWNGKLSQFVFVNEFVSGPIDEIEILSNKAKELEFITSYSSTEMVNCSLKALKLWSLKQEGIALKRNVAMDYGSMIYTQAGNNKTLWCLSNNTLKEYDLKTLKLKESWHLTDKENTTAYRFIKGLSKQSPVMMTNGEDIMILGQPFNNKTLKEPFNILRPTASSDFKLNTFQSLLKPKHNFSPYNASKDFNTAIERILIELNERLHYQVKITQLSIPETDLFDEHLITDFTSLMQQLQQQQMIIPSDIWNINFTAIAMPATPAQVLAARIAQITWPIVKQIEQLHSYLPINNTHKHQECWNIKIQLAYLIKEVLMQANNLNENHDNNALNQVIETLHKFENYLQTFIKTLAQKPKIVKATPQHFLINEFHLEEFRSVNLTKDLIMLKTNSFLPGYQQGEILSLEVGSPKKPINLWAVIHNTEPFKETNGPGLYIYLHSYQKHLYQHVPALKPHCLQQLRFKQQTLLMFIENSTQIKILQYEGSQGFQPLAEITQEEPVKQLLTVDVFAGDKSFKKKYFLIVVMEKTLRFYEFVMQGVPIELEIPACCRN